MSKPLIHVQQSTEGLRIRTVLTRGDGFTLVELMVVMAIISVLATILFPVLEGAIRQSRITYCLNNMKQIGMMLSMYSSEGNGMVPNTAGKHTIHPTNGTANIAVMSGSTSACSLGTNKLRPIGFGWFYRLRYLEPSANVMGLNCPDEPTYMNGRTAIDAAEKTWPGPIYLPWTKELAKGTDFLPTAAGGNGVYDCMPYAAATSYFYRGGHLKREIAGPSHYLPRMSSWPAKRAVAVDYETYPKVPYGGMHGDGLNILFADGGAAFGGLDRAGMPAWAYASMTVEGRTYTQAIGGAGNTSHSGMPYAGNGAFDWIWAYYESTRK